MYLFIHFTVWLNCAWNSVKKLFDNSHIIDDSFDETRGTKLRWCRHSTNLPLIQYQMVNGRLNAKDTKIVKSNEIIKFLRQISDKNNEIFQIFL